MRERDSCEYPFPLKFLQQLLFLIRKSPYLSSSCNPYKGALQTPAEPGQAGRTDASRTWPWLSCIQGLPCASKGLEPQGNAQETGQKSCWNGWFSSLDAWQKTKAAAWTHKHHSSPPFCSAQSKQKRASVVCFSLGREKVYRVPQNADKAGVWGLLLGRPYVGDAYSFNSQVKPQRA